MERQTRQKLETLRSDRGSEFKSNQFKEYCERMGIRREFTAPYSPQQNGIAEHKNRTLVDKARSMLNARKLPTKFWAEAIATTAYLSNISPTQAIANRTPYEAWWGVKHTVCHLKVFGCIVLTHLPSHTL